MIHTFSNLSETKARNRYFRLFSKRIRTQTEFNKINFICRDSIELKYKLACDPEIFPNRIVCGKGLKVLSR